MKRYSIITDDLEHCIECGRTNINKHEVFFGTANRQKSIEDGCVVPLCGLHHNLSNAGVHFNKALDNRIKQQAEKV